jgi:hypothetical protein
METFVVRVWVPADVETEGPPAGLHGLVEHVPSKRGRTFRGEADLVAFIHACLPGPSPPPEPPAPPPRRVPARDVAAIPQPGTDARDAPSVRGIPGAGPICQDQAEA